MLNEDKEGIIEYCKNCFGTRECYCENPQYVKTWDFIYWIFKKLKM